MHVAAETFHVAAINAFLAAWTTDSVNLRTPVKLRNLDGLLTKVDGSVRISEAPRNGEWVEFAIEEEGLGQLEFGSPGQNTAPAMGYLVAEIYVPKGVGEMRAKQLSTLARTALQKKTIAGVNTHAARGPYDVGEVEVWYRFDVSVPYFRPEQV